MLNAIDIDTAAHILFAADQHNAENLRERCMEYILQHFDDVSQTSSFEEMGRLNMDLGKTDIPYISYCFCLLMIYVLE